MSISPCPGHKTTVLDTVVQVAWNEKDFRCSDRPFPELMSLCARHELSPRDRTRNVAIISDERFTVNGCSTKNALFLLPRRFPDYNEVLTQITVLSLKCWSVFRSNWTWWLSLSTTPSRYTPLVPIYEKLQTLKPFTADFSLSVGLMCY